MLYVKDYTHAAGWFLVLAGVLGLVGMLTAWLPVG